MDLVKLQLRERAALVQAVSQCSPLPDRPERGLEVKVATYLKLIHDLHCTLRYCFQCIEMRSSLLGDAGRIVPPVPSLDRILVNIAVYLMVPNECSTLELMYLGVVKESDDLITVLTNTYNTFLQYPPSHRPLDTGIPTMAIKEAALGWYSGARSSLPLAETALLLEARSAGYLGAPLSHFWKSRVLNAITVSPSQGQREWLAVVSDTLAVDLEKVKDLDWVATVIADASNGFVGSQSLVINEIVMTGLTIEKPNELFSLINPVYVNCKISELIYGARRDFSRLRQAPGTPAALQPGKPAKEMIRLVRKALQCADSAKRKQFYGKWIESEWDAPSILFDTSEIRDILKHLDDDLSKVYIPNEVLRVLVVDHRGLKSVCARARGVAHTALSRMGPSGLSPDVDNPFAEVRDALAKSLQTFELSRAEFASHAGSQGLVFDNTRIIGTDAQQIERPRRLWDLVFNVTIESVYTTLPWLAVSHSWAQADGDCVCAINERANVIPWATREDLNNVRAAALQAGFTMAWMDKVCLRQRGTNGFDSALRHLEWFTDIPFIDVAYSKAAKVLVYLEGAGRSLRYYSTFREKTSWLYRKWTAQETPSGVNIMLGSKDQCLDGDFFELCEKAVRSWHFRNHRGREMTVQTCTACNDIRRRLAAVQNLRNLSEQTSHIERLNCVWDVMHGRAAGSEADHCFSLLSLLGTDKRPRYDASYNREQAAALVYDHLKPGMRAALGAVEYATWFEGMFSGKSSTVSENAETLLAAFRPGDASTGQVIRYQLRGILSFKNAVQMNINGRIVGIFDSTYDQTKKLCACRDEGRPLNLGSQDIYSDHFIWHGISACCASVFDMVATDGDQVALGTASHLLLSDNNMKCVLLKFSGTNEHKDGAYQIIRNRHVITSSTRSQWVFKRKNVQSQFYLCQGKD